MFFFSDKVYCWSIWIWQRIDYWLLQKQYYFQAVEMYLDPGQTSRMMLSAEIAHGLKSLTVFPDLSDLDVWLVPQCISALDHVKQVKRSVFSSRFNFLVCFILYIGLFWLLFYRILIFFLILSLFFYFFLFLSINLTVYNFYTWQSVEDL